MTKRDSECEMSSPQQRYEALIADGSLRADDAQGAAVEQLDALWAVLDGYAPEAGGGIFGLFAKKVEAPKGLYLYGGVGRGKSMLMDLFFDLAKVEKKRRVHFHAFMAEIHDGMAEARASGERDPVQIVADAVIAEAHLLCFDELQITDIADAMIVGRLFDKLFEAGVVVVTTSNRHPDDLYKDGLNRKLFLPFIEMVKEKMALHLLDSETDHRRAILSGTARYISPPDGAAMNAVWQALAGGEGAPLTLQNKGRQLVVPRFLNGVGRAGFEELCAQAYGPSDYLVIVGALRVLMLEDVPILSRARNNEAKRFVTLVDAMYEAGTRLVMGAEALPEALYQEGAGAFEFERTASRITEMCFGQWPREEGA